MNECKLINRLLPLYIAGEGLSLKEEIFVETHLEKCSKCLSKTQSLQNIIQSTREIDQEIKDLTKTIDWNKNRSDILDRITQEEKPIINIDYSGNRFFSLRTGLIAASVFLIGILTGYFIFYSPQLNISNTVNSSNNLYSVSVIEQNFKKNTIIDYFKQIRFYFLEITESEDMKEINLEHNKLLLAQTRYLQNGIRDDYSLISAEELLKDIEFVLIEIDQSVEDTQNNNFTFIKDLIRNRRLLLKIHLTRKDIMNTGDEV